MVQNFSNKKHYNLIRIIILLLIIPFYLLHGKNSPTGDYKYPKCEISKLLHTHPDSTLLLIEEGISYAKRKNDRDLLARCYLDKGILFKHFNPNLALEAYHKALKIYEEADNKTGVALCLYDISALINNRDEKLSHLRTALSLFKDTKYDRGIAATYNSLSAYYRDTCPDSSLYYIEKFRCLSENIPLEDVLPAYHINMATYFLNRKEYKVALEYLYQAKKISANTIYTPEIDANMIEAYYYLDMQDSALYYYNLLKGKFHHRPDLGYIIYSFLTEHYAETKDFSKAYKFRKLTDSINNILISRKNKNQLELLELEHNSRLGEERLEKLNAEIKQSDIARLFLSILLGLTLVFSSIIIYQQRQKSKKKQHIIEQNKRHLEERKQRLEAEQKLLTSELENSELKRKYLHDELKYTNRELSSFATSIVQNHTLWDDVRTRIEAISREKNRDDMKVMLRDLNTMLLQVFTSNEQRYEFIQRSRQLNHSIVFYLKTNYEALTEKDINMLILNLLKFTPKEIAVLCNIEPQSVKKKRQRVRKRLGLETEESLEEFFDRIMEEIEMRGTG